MSLLSPEIVFGKNTEPYVGPLKVLSALLESGDLGSLPTPQDPLPGPFVSAEISSSPSVKKQAIYLLRWDQSEVQMSRYLFNVFVLEMIFGIESGECDKYEQELYERIFL